MANKYAMNGVDLQTVIFVIYFKLWNNAPLVKRVAFRDSKLYFPMFHFYNILNNLNWVMAQEEHSTTGWVCCCLALVWSRHHAPTCQEHAKYEWLSLSSHFIGSQYKKKASCCRLVANYVGTVLCDNQHLDQVCPEATPLAFSLPPSLLLQSTFPVPSIKKWTYLYSVGPCYTCWNLGHSWVHQDRTYPT